MSNKTWLSLALVLFLALMLIWLFTDRSSVVSTYLTEKRFSSTSSGQSHIMASPSSPLSAVRSTPLRPKVNASPVPADLPPREKALGEVYNQVLDIDGRVEDDRSLLPISDAAVHLSVAQLSLGQNVSVADYNSITDGDGRFSLHDVRGRDMLVQVQKDGYYQTLHSKQMYVSHDHAPNPLLREHALSKDASDPVVLTLRKKGNPIPLINVQHGTVLLYKNAQPVDISLVTGRAQVHGGDVIRLENMVQTPDVPDGNYDWQCVISVPGGGLVSRRDEFDFVAPALGYQQTDVIYMPKSLPRGQWQTDVFRDYFIRTQAGHYARVNIRVITRGSGSCVIESYLNPTVEDRNLEFSSPIDLD